VLLLICVNCRRDSTDGESGQIRFAITYEQDRVGGYSTTVLPKEMVMAYSGDMVRNTIEGGLGFFQLVHVSDLRYDQHTTWLRFIDKKYIYEGERKETPCCFGMLAGMQLDFTDESKEIAGLPCKKVVASFPPNTLDPFDIWYTEQIELDNPNANTPFMDIPGVLLEFNTFMGNANMHVVATQYEKLKIPDKQFLPPKNHRSVSKEEMETILNALMD
jgi:hypothetical protein